MGGFPRMAIHARDQAGGHSIMFEAPNAVGAVASRTNSAQILYRALDLCGKFRNIAVYRPKSESTVRKTGAALQAALRIQIDNEEIRDEALGG